MPPKIKAAKKSKAKSSAKSAPKSEADFYIRFFALVEKRGWFALTLPEIAKATGVTLPELLKRYPDRSDILRGFGMMLDAQLADAPVEAEGSAKDRLFDIIMRRFDALVPYRAGVVRLLEDMQSHPIAAVMLCLETLCGFNRSMALMFEMAGISRAHPKAILGIIGLKIVYLSTVRTWKYDDSADLSATMAILDRGLERLTKVLKFD